MAHSTTRFTAQFTSRHSQGSPNYCNGPRCNDRATLPRLQNTQTPAALALTVRLLVLPALRDCAYPRHRQRTDHGADLMKSGYVERPRTTARTSGPNCSSLRAPMPGIATSAASSAGRWSGLGDRVL